VKVRKAYNRRILGHQYQEELKRLSKQLLLAKRKAQESLLRYILKNEGKIWVEFYKYVKRRKGNKEDTVTIKDINGWLITDSIAKANSLNFYYCSAFSCECSISQIQCAYSYEPFAIRTKIIRGRSAAIDKNKSVGPDKVSDQILKVGGEVMIPYLAHLLDTTVSNATIPSY
jgi:signal peptidase I